MKKTVVVDLEYMRPSVKGRARSRSRSTSSVNRIITDAIEKSELCDEYELDEDMNIDALLKIHQDIDDDSRGNSGRDDDDDDEEDDEGDDDDIIESSDDYASSGSSGNEIIRHRHPSVKDTDYAVNSDDDLLQSVLDEPTFPLEKNAILSAMTKTENLTIANMTMKKIAERRHEIISSLNLTPEKRDEFERKLQMYRVIEDPNDLKHNQLIRWIPLRSLETRPYITLGGCLFRIKYNEEEAVHIVTIRNVKRFVFNIKFELNVVFQRLSQEELLIMRAVEYVETED